MITIALGIIFVIWVLASLVEAQEIAETRSYADYIVYIACLDKLHLEKLAAQDAEEARLLR